MSHVKVFSFFMIFALTLVVIAGMPQDAFATSFNGVQHNVADNISHTPKLIAYFAYILGTLFAVRALLALKGYIENPDENPIMKFLGLAGTSAMLILLPFVIDVTIITLAGSKSSTEIGASATSFSDDGK